MKDYIFSDRLMKFPPYLFAEIDRKKSQLKADGIKFTDLSIGDPDILAPQSAVLALAESAKIKENQKYALDQGKQELREAIVKWFARRFGVSLDEKSEVLPLIGSKEGLIHFPLAFVNKSDYVLIPLPGYPGYRSAALFAGAKIYEVALRAKNNFLPDLEKIPLSVRNKAKMIYLNYPNNPTTALAPIDFLEALVKFCSKYGIILAYDNAYSEIYFEDKPHSVLEVDGAKEVAVEFHSLSKTFCMTGFRVGWAAGNKRLLAGLLKVKANIDSGIFGAVQEAARVCLEKEDDYIANLRSIFKERRDIFIKHLKKKKFRGKSIYSKATFYVWTKIPKPYKRSIEYADYLLSERNIVATPGLGFGKFGEGYIRFALTLDKNKLATVDI